MIFKRKYKHDAPREAVANWNEPWFYNQKDNGFYKIAIIIDGEVQEIMTTEARLAALLLSDPIFVDVTEKQDCTHIGDKYNEESGGIVRNEEEKI
jgi:hypothetical protein